MRYVTIEKASDLTGYTPDAIRSKIKRGDWIEGAVWHHAPDGRVLIDLQGYEKWVEGSLQHLACGFGPRNRSRSTRSLCCLLSGDSRSHGCETISRAFGLTHLNMASLAWPQACASPSSSSTGNVEETPRSPVVDVRIHCPIRVAM